MGISLLLPREGSRVLTLLGHLPLPFHSTVLPNSSVFFLQLSHVLTFLQLSAQGRIESLHILHTLTFEQEGKCRAVSLGMVASCTGLLGDASAGVRAGAANVRIIPRAHVLALCSAVIRRCRAAVPCISEWHSSARPSASPVCSLDISLGQIRLAKRCQQCAGGATRVGASRHFVSPCRCRLCVNFYNNATYVLHFTHPPSVLCSTHTTLQHLKHLTRVQRISTTYF